MTRAAIEKDRVTAVILLFLIAAGMTAYQGLPRAEDPEITYRRAVVLTQLPGASTNRIEHLVTDTIEATLQEIPEIEYIASRSRTGVSLITVRVRDDVGDVQAVWDNLRRKVARVAPDLPDGTIGPVVNDEFGDIFGIIVTLTGDGYSYAELKQMADAVRDDLLRIDDVAKVHIYGAQDQRIFVDYEHERLAEVGLGPLQLRSILGSVNVLIPGGEVRTGVERIALQPTGSFESVDDLRRTIVTLPGRSELVALENLASISRGYVEPPTHLVYASGTPGLALAISMRAGGNVIALGTDVRREIARLQASYPIGVEFDIVRFQPEVVSTRLRTFIGSLLQSVGIVVGVLLLFMGLRTGFVVASLVPMTILVTLFLMSVFGIGLHQVSLAGLILALGMLVDNAIVMTDAITAQMEVGRRPIDAALNAAQELRSPLLVASLTTAGRVPADLPRRVVHRGIHGAALQGGHHHASRVMDPGVDPHAAALCAPAPEPAGQRIGSKGPPTNSTRACSSHSKRADLTAAGEVYDSRLYRTYRALLLAGLRHRAIALAVVVAVFLVAMQGFRFLPSTFFPPSDQAIFTAAYDLPAGTSIERTAQGRRGDRSLHRPRVATGRRSTTGRGRRASLRGRDQLDHLRRQRGATFLHGARAGIEQRRACLHHSEHDQPRRYHQYPHPSAPGVLPGAVPRPPRHAQDPADRHTVRGAGRGAAVGA